MGITHFLGTVLDTSAQQDAAQRFELAIEGSRDAIFDWIVADNHVHYSSRWQELLKLSASEIDPVIGFLFDHVAPSDTQRVESELTDFVINGESHFESEFPMVATDGGDVQVLLRAAAIRDKDGVAKRVSGSLADISSLKAAEEELRCLLQKDHLTGLASRSFLLDRLQHAIARSRRSGKLCGILFFDFDRFKVVNDSLGHDVGDELLCSIAGRLRDNVREVDTVARFGGDEFVILLDDLPDTEVARAVATKLLALCAKPHSIRGHNLISTASIGMVTTEQTGCDPDELLRDADAAMYEAKWQGRDCLVEFDKQMHESRLDRLKLEEDLQTAAGNEQLLLHYQPIVDLETGAIVSAEALLRWDHPVRGMVSPSDFISIAEESKLIVPIGAWVIEQACRQIADWRQRGIVSENFALSVNVSKVQLLSPEFVSSLVSSVDAHNLPRHAIKVEVTETTVIDNRSDIGKVLSDLRQESIIVMMDDFGTGHSSLSGLHTLPIDELKIDQSFIRNTETESNLVAITSAIVTLADHLSLRTVGEGIETAEHIASLQAMGCACGQGYYWSRPLPAAKFEAFISEQRSVECAALLA